MSTLCESDALWENDNADLVLRSSDGQYFKVDKILLVRAFQAFEDMFMGTGIGTGAEQEMKDDRQVVDLAETAVVLKTLLRLIYNMGANNDDVDSTVIDPLCVALDKYCVKSYPRAVIDKLIALAEDEPERSYIRACRFRLDGVARATASASLRVPRLFANVSLLELGNLTARQYHVLMSYRSDCLAKAISAVEDFAWMARLEPTPPGLGYDRSCERCHKAGPRAWLDPNPAPHLNLSPASRKVLLKPRPVYVSTWLSRYLELVEAALLKDTSGGVAQHQQHINVVFSTDSPACCDSCRTAANALDMVYFAERLGKEIDTRITEIPFSLTYAD